VIDWVDICRADVGQDLQLLWSFLPPSARDEFLDEYGLSPSTPSCERACSPST